MHRLPSLGDGDSQVGMCPTPDSGYAVLSQSDKRAHLSHHSLFKKGSWGIERLII